MLKELRRIIQGFVKTPGSGEAAGQFVDLGEVRPVAIDDEGLVLTRIAGAGGTEILGILSPDDNVPTSTRGVATLSFTYGFDGTNWDRIFAGDTDGGTVANNEKALDTFALLYGFNGSSWSAGEIGFSSSDALTTFTNTLASKAFGYKFNGNDFDRERNNEAFEVLASAARTATNNSSDFTNYNSRGLHIAFDVTAVSGTGSVTPVIQGLDPSSGKYYDLLVGPAVTATGLNIIKLYPGIVASANASASDILPRTWRVETRHADASSYTYSVGANVVN